MNPTPEIYDFDQYLHQPESNQQPKTSNWSTAAGLQQVDGLKPSSCLIENAKQNIAGNITIDEV